MNAIIDGVIAAQGEEILLAFKPPKKVDAELLENSLEVLRNPDLFKKGRAGESQGIIKFLEDTVKNNADFTHMMLAIKQLTESGELTNAHQKLLFRMVVSLSKFEPKKKTAKELKEELKEAEPVAVADPEAEAPKPKAKPKAKPQEMKMGTA